MFGQMEKKLQEMHTKEDDILSHYHSPLRRTYSSVVRPVFSAL